MLVKRQPKSKRRPQKGNPPSYSGFGKQTFPKHLCNTLTYVEQQPLTLTTGFGKYIFSANGLFDPNITGTGHQPLYFDQLTALYNHYTVVRSRIQVNVVGQTAFTSPYFISLYVDDDTTTATDALLASERVGSSFSAATPAVAPFDVLNASWDARKFFGPNPQDQAELRGTSSANPTEQSYFVIQAYDPSGSSSTLQMFVRIHFDVIWDELTTIGPS